MSLEKLRTLHCILSFFLFFFLFFFIAFSLSIHFPQCVTVNLFLNGPIFKVFFSTQYGDSRSPIGRDYMPCILNRIWSISLFLKVVFYPLPIVRIGISNGWFGSRSKIFMITISCRMPSTSISLLRDFVIFLCIFFVYMRLI